MKNKLRIMLDTNILISTAIFSSSKMLAVIEYIKENHYLVLSFYVLDELNTVVKRKFINKYGKVEVSNPIGRIRKECGFMKRTIESPYLLVLKSTDWVGNFERELIGYSMGILDDVQMDINHSEEEREQFWKDMVEQKKTGPLFSFEHVPGYCEASEEYPLLREFLDETYQTVDDWEQSTFYNVDGLGELSELKIQLTKPLIDEYEAVIIERMIQYGKDNNRNITSLELLKTGTNERVVKKYV